MPPPRTRTAASVERFFQFSLLGLIMSGYFALAASGYLDRPTLILTMLGLLVRAAIVAGLVRIEFPSWIVSVAGLVYIAFFPIDFYFLSHEFLTPVVHGVCFLATVKILTARSNRDYIYTGVISFMELIAAALLSAQSSFFACLALYVVFAIAAFTSAEMRRGFERQGQIAAPARARVGWRLGVIAIAATAGILVITVGLFLIVPRTARMAAMLFPNGPRLVGFSNGFALGGLGAISRDDRAVMHILPYSGALPADLKWRGAALSHFDGRRWSEMPFPIHPVATEDGHAEVANQFQRSRRDGRRLIYRVDVQNSGLGTLFIAGIPEFINIDARNLLVTAEDAFRVYWPPGQAMRYEVSAHSGPPLATALSPAERFRDLELPLIDPRVVLLAQKWSGEGTPLERALAIQSHLRKDFKYVLDGPEKPVRDPLADFLFVRKAGYCEYFASAMAVMLRAEGIPARVATGFQTGYFNDVSGFYVVRASDAHAWVEGWVPGRGWVTFDPTPTASETRNSLFSRLNMYLDAADHTWQDWVVAYDPGQQVAIAMKFEAALRGWRHSGMTPSRSWMNRFAAKAKWWSLWLLTASLLVGGGIVFGPRIWREWRVRVRLRRIVREGGSPSDASILYERMLAVLERRGFEKPAWFTPVEFARHLPEGQIQIVQQFTALYNSIRFGGNVAGTSRLALLLQELERAD